MYARPVNDDFRSCIHTASEMSSLRSKHVPGREHFECTNDGIKKVYDVLVLLVVRTVAGNIEGGRARSMFGELIVRKLSHHCKCARYVVNAPLP